MTDNDRKRSWSRAIPAVLLLALFLWSIEDWSRDFVGYEASISDRAAADLQPMRSMRSADELSLAVQAAGGRILNWEFVGETRDADTRILLFLRTGRLTRVRDDILIRIEDRRNERVLYGESRSRLHLGDLGRNPRNLKRLLHELDSVLAGTSNHRARSPEVRG